MSAIEAVAETSRPSLLLATIPLTRGTVRRARWATTSGRSGQQYLMPASLRDWLPEEDVVWLFLDAVDQMDLGPIFARYRTDGWGAPAFGPALMTTLLLHAYATRERSSRRSVPGCIAGSNAFEPHPLIKVESRVQKVEKKPRVDRQTASVPTPVEPPSGIASSLPLGLDWRPKRSVVGPFGRVGDVDSLRPRGRTDDGARGGTATDRSCPSRQSRVSIVRSVPDRSRRMLS